MAAGCIAPLPTAQEKWQDSEVAQGQYIPQQHIEKMHLHRGVEGFTDFQPPFPFPKMIKSATLDHHRVRTVAGHVWKSHLYSLAPGEFPSLNCKSPLLATKGPWSTESHTCLWKTTLTVITQHLMAPKQGDENREESLHHQCLLWEKDYMCKDASPPCWEPKTGTEVPLGLTG